MKILNWQLFLEELVGETSISDVDSYISGMEKGMQDKLFFVNKVDFDVIVDFGCANGSFLSKVQALNPNVKIIGYDLDDNMLNKARSILDKNALLTSNWSEVISELSNYESPLLNLSSVIHEVYSYSHSSVIKKFWQQQVFGGSFKTITIRDMIPSSKIERNEIENFKKDVTKVRKRANSFYLDDFEKKWGSISDNYRTFCHFLLKYKYISNWDREVIENYLPVSLETLKKKIPSDYSILFEQDFILPYTQQELGKDFGVKITHSTHIKMIIERKK